MYSHLSGYRDSKPVRIGNGAAFHLQFDIYGELMDGIYLYNKYGKPVTWEQWVAIREILDYVMTIWQEPDMSIWEVRSRKQNYTYSKVMLWVAFDRGLRLADKRCLPCPNRAKWMAIRDTIYEDIMEKGMCCPCMFPPILTTSRLQSRDSLFCSELRKWGLPRLLDPDCSSSILHFSK